MSDTDTVFDNWKSLRQKISNQRLPNAMTELTLKIEEEAILRAPVAVGTLVNSAGHSIQKTARGWEGKTFFLANYAFYVHESSGKLLGRGVYRSPSTLGKVWDGYNGTAEPEFLKNAAEYVFSSGLAQKIIEDNLT